MAGTVEEPAGGQPHAGTLIAIAVVAGALTAVLHEAVGHGSACALSGGHNLSISSVAEQCSLDNGWIEAAGTLVNLAAGLVGWAVQRQLRAPRARYFFWLLMAFNLLSAAGYWLYSGIANIGDWAVILAGHRPAWLWHLGMTVAGAAVYFGFLVVTLRELRPFLGSGPAAKPRARRLMLVPYFSYGVLYVISGLFNPVGPVLIATSAAAASFGGQSGLWWGLNYLPRRGNEPPTPAEMPVGKSWGWMGAGGVVALAFIFWLGPGWRP